jgi:G:T-mismatch repair DNA endonuclease (very short patch repair protein)
MGKKKSKIGKLFKKMKGTSKLEVNFALLLDNLNIKYEQHFMFKKREYDFLLLDYNIIIETHGCFYHCCKEHFSKPKYPFQKRNIKNDQLKVRNVKLDKKYNLIIIWEHEMTNKDDIKIKLNEFITKHNQITLN